jgi:hypothetical protein
MVGLSLLALVSPPPTITAGVAAAGTGTGPDPVAPSTGDTDVIVIFIQTAMKRLYLQFPVDNYTQIQQCKWHAGSIFQKWETKRKNR